MHVLADIPNACTQVEPPVIVGIRWTAIVLLHRNSTVARRVTKVTSEHYGDLSSPRLCFFIVI